MLRRPQEESPPSGNSPLDRLAARFRTEGVSWMDMFRFLQVDDWAAWEQKFSRDGDTVEGRQRVATLEAWKRYEEDNKYRESGCKKCRAPADVPGQLWCRNCIDEAEAEEPEQYTESDGEEAETAGYGGNATQRHQAII